MGYDGFSLLPCFLVFCCFIKPMDSHLPNTDGYFLSDFFQKMGLNSSPAFNFSADVCSWMFVTCDARNRSVISLVASDQGLSGPIPDEAIAKLEKIQHLDLSNNKITDFSADFWSLGSTLITLNLSFNRIRAQLSSNIGNFFRLETLDLSHNGFSGAIPADLGSMSSLRTLNLSRNRFDGEIPRGILDCGGLVSVDLSWNNLSGNLPTGIGAALQNLSALNLARNRIEGSIFEISSLKSLAYLNLSGNRFNGTIAGLLRMPLKIIGLSKKLFQGQSFRGNRNSSSNLASLVFLDLSDNRLNGDFLEDFNLAQRLEFLNLAHNRFSEQNFPRVGMLSRLEYLNLSKTNLSGTIPVEISELGSLKTLDLSQNHLSGTVPDLCTNINLQILDLSTNNLRGEIPPHLVQKLPGMAQFNLSCNNLSLCGANFSREVFLASFMGAQDDCPIVANPALFRRKKSENREVMSTLAIMFSVFVFLVAFICLVFAFRRNSPPSSAKRASRSFPFQTDPAAWVADVKQANSVPVVLFSKPLLNFTFADLLSATSQFDREALLAEGRFGPVYRGLLPGGVHAAVKVLIHGSTMADGEIARELERLGRIKHPNLVPLIGYCLAGDQKIAIYEYMENGNLQNLLQDLPLGAHITEDWSTDTWEDDGAGVQISTIQGLTTWAFRHSIALGIARALSFLHHGCCPSIIHRDVKASSIYIGSSLEPRLSYFGLANIVQMELDENDLPAASPGYSPPEFSESEDATMTLKTDVYAFGVVLFELITGKKPVGDDYLGERDSNLVHWARGLVRKNQGSRAIDPKIRRTGPEVQMEEALRIGYLCTADSPAKRPSMQQIVGLLKDIDPLAAL